MGIGKRKALLDITNDFKITDTHTLRKLVESTPRSAQKIAKSILKANVGSARENICSELVTGFGTSIRSSNVGAPRNTRAVQFRPPPRAAASATVSQCAGAVPYNASPTEKMKYNEPRTVNPKCLFERKNEATMEKLSVPQGISIGKPHKGKDIFDFSSEWPSCSYKKDRMEEILNPPNSIVKEANHKGSHAAVAVRRKSESRKTSYTKYSNYPPLTKTKSNFSGLTEPGDQEDLKFWTEPRKRNFASKVYDATELPQEWIDKWRAHFKEVDEFPLEIEEASCDELE